MKVNNIFVDSVILIWRYIKWKGKKVLMCILRVICMNVKIRNFKILLNIGVYVKYYKDKLREW